MSLVPRLWAAEYARRLLGTGQSAEDNRSKVLDLGLEYGLMTPYTSFLALDSEAAYAQQGIKRHNPRLRGARLTSITGPRAEAELGALFELSSPRVMTGCSKSDEAPSAAASREGSGRSRGADMPAAAPGGHDHDDASEGRARLHQRGLRRKVGRRRIERSQCGRRPGERRRRVCGGERDEPTRRAAPSPHGRASRLRDDEQAIGRERPEREQRQDDGRREGRHRGAASGKRRGEKSAAGAASLPDQARSRHVQRRRQPSFGRTDRALATAAEASEGAARRRVSI